ncbi:hypothetical protein [Campylobacter armoricus]|nr:hypothetical protein [Campylobacter armoricus]
MINKFFTQEELCERAWRIPFLLDEILGLFLLICVNFLRETPVFE